MKLVNYYDVREQMRPGDCVAFGGRGAFSSAIKFFTRSVVSHVGIIQHSQMLDDTTDRYFNLICESTQIGDFAGVTTNQLSVRLAQYDGEVWWLPLSDECRARFNLVGFWNWIYAQEGKHYDLPQAILSGFDMLDRFGIGLAEEDYSELFCSELLIGGVKTHAPRADGAPMGGGVLGADVNASEVIPIEAVLWPGLWAEASQLKGEPMEIE